MEINKCQLVRDSCRWVHSQAQHVTIHVQALTSLADKFINPHQFDSDSFHETSTDPEKALLQLFMLDFLNFCFWPLVGFQYEHLATNVQQAVKEGISLNDLKDISQETVRDKIFHGQKIPQLDQRSRILRELQSIVRIHFDGSLVKLVQSAKQSAVNLLNIFTTHFTNFQDHMIYKGHQIHFYKRAQILIGDIYAKYHGKGLGSFKDIDQLTMFPDYRVPQVLQAQGVFIYSPALAQKINLKEQITDRYEQAELRASSVVAVEMLKECLLKKGKQVMSIQLDWFLWQRGEQNLTNLPPHHRCLTIYY